MGPEELDLVTDLVVEGLRPKTFELNEKKRKKIQKSELYYLDGYIVMVFSSKSIYIIKTFSILVAM